MTTIINGKVYYGGGASVNEHHRHQYTVCCYDPSRDEWTTVPPLPAAVRCFGLGQVNDKLVTVGGKEEGDKITVATDKVYVYDEQSQKWNSLAPMLTARFSPGVLSLKSALIVAGGAALTKKTNFFGRTSYIPTELNIVEVFKPDMLQWYQMNPLPRACYGISLISIGNKCYALGGSIFFAEVGATAEITLDQALFASTDDLLHSAEPITKSVWKKLPGNTPSFTSNPAAALLAGNLLAVVAHSSNWFEKPTGIYMYQSSKNSWIHIGAPPKSSFSQADLAVAILSSLEILVINHKNNCVHRGAPLFFE